MSSSTIGPKEPVDDLGGLAFQFFTTSAVGIAAIAFFCFARPLNENVYQPNKVLQRSFKRRGLQQFFHDSKVPEKLPEVSKSIFGWFKVVYYTTEKELLDSLGIDATMFIKVLYCFVKISPVFFISGIMTMGLNYFSLSLGFRQLPQIPGRGSKISDWDVDQAILYDSSFVWGHIFMAYILAGYVFYVFNDLWKDFVDMRQTYFRSPAYYNAVHSRTILVTNLKSSMLTDEALSIAMHNVNVNHFSSCTVGLKLTPLQDAVEKREKYILELENVLNFTFSHALTLHHPDSVANLPLPNARLPPEAVKLCEKLKTLNSQIYDMRHKGCEATPIHAGFVEFEHPELCHEVVEQLKGKASDGLCIEPAPSPCDLIWPNLGSDPSIRLRLRRIGNLFVIGLCFGWLFLLNAILPFTDPNTLMAIWPSLITFFSNHQTFVSYIRSMVPPLLYNGFLIFVPILFRKISDYQGAYTKALRTRDTIRKVYLFYVLGFFVLFTLSSTAQKLLLGVASLVDTRGTNAADVTRSILGQMYMILDQLVNVFVKSGTFWVGYTLNGTGFIHIELVRAAALILTWFKRNFLHLTPREAMLISAPPEFKFDEVGAVILFWFFISMTYAIVQPFVVLITSFYFLFATIIYKWELMYIFGRGSDTAGDFYPTMYKRVAATVLTSQGLFIMLLLVKQLWIQTIAMFALFAVSVWVNNRIYLSHLAKAMYFDPRYGPYDQEVLRRDRESRLSGPRERYLHPVLVEHLILPLVDPRIEHLLVPWFPELAINDKSLKKQPGYDTIDGNNCVPPAVESAAGMVTVEMNNVPSSPNGNKSTYINHMYHENPSVNSLPDSRHYMLPQSTALSVMRPGQPAGIPSNPQYNHYHNNNNSMSSINVSTAYNHHPPYPAYATGQGVQYVEMQPTGREVACQFQPGQYHPR